MDHLAIESQAKRHRSTAPTGHAAHAEATASGPDAEARDVRANASANHELGQKRKFGQESTVAPEAFKVGDIYRVLPGRLSFSVHRDQEHSADEIARNRKKFFFSSDFQTQYVPFCLDFGPVDLSVVHEFCEYMLEKWNDPRLAKRELVYYSEPEIDLRTNSAFLIAAFLVTRLGFSPEEAWAPFARIPLCEGQQDTFAAYRDATFYKAEYELSVKSCLEGLARGVALGWYDPKTFNIEKYRLLQDPSVADMHVICPKFCAFKGPTAERKQLMPGCWSVAARHWASLFKHMGVSGVVRLNDADTYDRKDFARAGVNHHDVFFHDCTTPSQRDVARFLDIAERETGMVAVHCYAGLGRTGCMIGCYLIKHFGFSAAAALGWLRIVRPGSVIGAQQEFLHHFEASLCTAEPVGAAPCPAPGPAEANEGELMGQQVALAQARRAKALLVGDDFDQLQAAAPELTDLRAGSNAPVAFGFSVVDSECCALASSCKRAALGVEGAAAASPSSPRILHQRS